MLACHVLDSVLGPEDSVGHREDIDAALTEHTATSNSVTGIIKCSRIPRKCKDRRALDEL